MRVMFVSDIVRVVYLGGMSGAQVSLLFRSVGESCARYREMPRVFVEGREGQNYCRGDAVVGACAQMSFWRQDG